MGTVGSRCARNIIHYQLISQNPSVLRMTYFDDKLMGTDVIYKIVSPNYVSKLKNEWCEKCGHIENCPNFTSEYFIRSKPKHTEKFQKL